MEIKNAVQVEGIFLFCDIRGFSTWMERNQLEVNNLLEMFYSSAFNNFGNPKDQKYHTRVAKLLGDGFLVVYEYEKSNQKMLKEKIKRLTSAIVAFRIEFYERLELSTLHGNKNIKCSFGFSYGPAIRFTIPGYPLDYVSHKINYIIIIIELIR